MLEKNGQQSQRGEIMLEAAIIFIPVLILVMALLSLGFFFYQEALMNTVASDIASEVANNFKYDTLGAHGDTLELTDIEAAKMFRTTFKLNELEGAQETRAKGYANWRVPLSTLGFGDQDPDVDVEMSFSNLGRVHVKVRVSQKTDFFLGGILRLAGIVNEENKFTATAYAECADPMGYASMVNFARYCSEELSAIDAVGNLYLSVKNLLSSLSIKY